MIEWSAHFRPISLLLEALDSVLAHEVDSEATVGEQAQIYMTHRDIESLDPQLVALGNHTLNHISLGSSNTEELRQEIVLSKDYLERMFPKFLKGKPFFFSFPFGQPEDSSIDARNMALDSGHYALFNATGRSNKPGGISYLLDRKPVPSVTGKGFPLCWKMLLLAILYEYWD